MIDGKTLYEHHRDEIESFDLPKPPPWSELSSTARRGWESAASDLAEKMLNDRKEMPA